MARCGFGNAFGSSERMGMMNGGCKVGLWRVSPWTERVGVGDCMALRDVR